jgi:hypothetical protein
MSLHEPQLRDDSRKHGHGEAFSEAEIAELQGDDRRAAKTVVSLMLAVFSLGCIGSLVIAIITSQN